MQQQQEHHHHGRIFDVDHLPSMLFLHTLPHHPCICIRNMRGVVSERERMTIFHEDKRGACIHTYTHKTAVFMYRKQHHHPNDDTPSHAHNANDVDYLYLFSPRNLHTAAINTKWVKKKSCYVTEREAS